MATHDYIISNASGASVRADLNNALAAIVSNNSNATSPATTYAYQWWADTTTGQLKLRNSANSAWVTIFELDGTMLMPDGSLAAPGLAFASDLDTGFSRSAANKINFSTGGAERLEIGSSEVVFNDPSNDVDFRVESSTKSHMLFVDAGNDRVGIGASAPDSTLEIASGPPSLKLTRTTAASTGNDFGRIIFENSAGTEVSRIDSVSTSGNTTPALKFSNGGAERFRVDDSGRLLIGATSVTHSDAQSRLQVHSAGATNIVVARNDSTISAGNTIGMLQFYGNDGGTYQQCAEIRCDADLDHAHNDKPSRLVFATTADGASSASERVRIDSSGNCGIGTTSPDFKLDVNGEVGITEGQALTWHDGSGGRSAQIYGGSGDVLVFRNTSSLNEIARFDASGRLLVGLSTVSANHTGKIVSRNDVDYTSTEFEDDATLVLQNETNNNSAVLVFHSNDSAGSSGRSAIVGGTVNNGKGKLGFYGSCINKDSSTDADVTIDANGRLLVGNTSPEGSDSLLETYKSSGQNHVRITSDSLANGEYCMFRAHADTSGGSDRIAYLGVYKHSGITNPGPFVFLEAENGSNAYYWTDNSGNFRTSGSTSHIGTTSGTVVGTQTSDLRLKNVGANVSYGLAEVKQLQPKQYALKTDPDVNKLGFIAQEVESIIPEAVFDTNEELDGHQEGDRTKLGMEYVQLIPVLVNAIKELSAEVDTLKTKVAALEAG